MFLLMFKKLIRYTIDKRLYRNEKYSPYHTQYMYAANREIFAQFFFFSPISLLFLASEFKTGQIQIFFFS